MIIKHMQRNILWGKSKSENKRKAKRTRCEGRKSGEKRAKRRKSGGTGNGGAFHFSDILFKHKVLP